MALAPAQLQRGGYSMQSLRKQASDMIVNRPHSAWVSVAQHTLKLIDMAIIQAALEALAV